MTTKTETDKPSAVVAPLGSPTRRRPPLLTTLLTEVTLAWLAKLKSA